MPGRVTKTSTSEHQLRACLATTPDATRAVRALCTVDLRPPTSAASFRTVLSSRRPPAPAKASTTRRVAASLHTLANGRKVAFHAPSAFNCRGLRFGACNQHSKGSCKAVRASRDVLLRLLDKLNERRRSV